MKKLMFILTILILFGGVINAETPTKISVTKLYIATFDRAPDAEGLNYWLNDSGLQLEGIAMSFFDQQETKDRYPLGFSHSDFIQAIYKNLFQREVDSDGFEYWNKELESDSIKQHLFILAIINGAIGDDAKVIDNKVTIGLKFVESKSDNIEESSKIMLNITADPSTINSILCIYKLSGCNEKSGIKEDSTEPMISKNIIKDKLINAIPIDTTPTSSEDSTSVESNSNSSSNTTPTDTISPTLTISDNTTEIVGVRLEDRLWVKDTVIFTFTFSESITGFTSSDITITNGEKGNFSGTGTSYTLVVIPLTNSKESILINVASGVAVDNSNNKNEEAEAIQEVNTQKAFITEWKTDNQGISDDNQILIETNSTYTYNYSIDWGDGKTDKGVTGDITHTYNSANTYLIKITGEFPNFVMNNNSTDNNKILSINQWGTIQWKSMYGSFMYCSNLDDDIILDDPNLSSVTNMSYMFYNATSFNQDVSGWDVSSVTDMSYMFYDATSFNQDISGWNISDTTNINNMFHNSTTPTKPIDSCLFIYDPNLDSEPNIKGYFIENRSIFCYYGKESNLLTMKPKVYGKTHGIARSYDISGNLKSEATYINGILEGIFKRFHENGSIFQDSIYENGKLNGILKFYYPDGSLMEEALYVSGKREGISETYYKDGTLMIEAIYENNERNGLSKIYRQDGTLDNESMYKDDKANGMSRSYDKDGILNGESIFKDDELNGISIHYNKDGSINNESMYINGKLEGLSQYYYQNNLSGEYMYKDGKLEGLYKSYHPNGMLSVRVIYKDGKEEGIYKSYYDDSTLYEEKIYKDGKLEGIYKSYYQNSILHIESIYKDGKKEGLYTSYNQDGKLGMESMYKDDKRNGLYKVYGSDGTLVMESMYKDDKINGLHKVYGSDGTLVGTHNYINGVLQ